MITLNFFSKKSRFSRRRGLHGYFGSSGLRRSRFAYLKVKYEGNTQRCNVGTSRTSEIAEVLQKPFGQLGKVNSKPGNVIYYANKQKNLKHKPKIPIQCFFQSQAPKLSCDTPPPYISCDARAAPTQAVFGFIVIDRIDKMTCIQFRRYLEIL